MVWFNRETGYYEEGDQPEVDTARAERRPQAPANTDPVTKEPALPFMQSPAVQRMLAAQAAGGTGRTVLSGGGGLGEMPMLGMLAPFLSQMPPQQTNPGMLGGRLGARPNPAASMSPLLMQLLPSMLAQRGAAPGAAPGVSPNGAPPAQVPAGADQSQRTIPPELLAMMAQRFGQMRG